ncbi:MAG: DUF4892 domain-containing protein [Pseudohongiellaceae bacterium]
MIRSLVWVCISLLSFEALAQSESPVHTESLVTPFPNSAVQSSSFVPDLVHEVALGILQRESGVARPEQARIVNGSLSKTLYEIPREYSEAAVFEFFNSQFVEREYEPLFSCSGRSCGSSNDWANDIFGNRLLYGPVQNQFYGVYQENADDSSSPYISVYVIKRGNRRLYSYIEVVEPMNPRPDEVPSEGPSLEAELLELGLVTLGELQFSNDVVRQAGQFEELVAVLNGNPELEIYIVSHLADSESLPRLLEKSQKRAESVMNVLLNEGVSGDRLSAHGLGPLAPSCQSPSCRTRIDIVRR